MLNSGSVSPCSPGRLCRTSWSINPYQEYIAELINSNINWVIENVGKPIQFTSNHKPKRSYFMLNNNTAIDKGWPSGHFGGK